MVLIPFFLPMFVHVHIPLIDCREFLRSFRRLPKPLFPAPRPGEFIRNFGGLHDRARERRTMGLQAGRPIPFSPGQRYYFATRGALRFDALPLRNAPVDGSAYTNICRFRRLHTAGAYMNRFELGFQLYGGAGSVDGVVAYLLSRAFRVLRPEGGYQTTTLAASGKYIASIYGASTTNDTGLPAKSVASGAPCCVVELNEREQTGIPPEATEVLRFPKEGIVLHHCLVAEGNAHTFDCWIVRHIRRHPDKVTAYRLRNALLQVHLECQTLRHAYPFLLHHASDQKLDMPRLAEFIRTVQARLLRATRFEIKTDKIVFTVLRATAAIQPGMMEELVEMVRRLGNRYMTADFLQLLSPVDMAEWRLGIEAELQKSWNPGTRAELEALRQLCTPSLRRQFAKVLSRCGEELWDIAKSILAAFVQSKMGF